MAPRTRSQAANTVSVNCLFFNEAHEPMPLYISIPHDLFIGPVQGCQELFATELKKEYKFKADLDSIDFFEPKEPTLTTTPDWNETFADWKTSTNPIPLTRKLSKVLEEKLDEDYLHLLVKAHEATEPGRTHSETRDVVAKPVLPEVERFKRALKESEASPSAMARPSAYANNQRNPSTAIYDGRNAPDENFILAPPIQIFHPVFEHFLRLLENPDLKVTARDAGNTFDLMENASDILPEADHVRELRNWLMEILDSDFYQEDDDGETESGGVLTFMLEDGTPVQLVIMKLKHEWEDDGCDVFSHIGLSMRQYWIDEANAKLRNKCCCPTFLVAGSDSWISILGGVFTDKFIIQRLTDMIPITLASTQGDDNIMRVARTLVALRECLKSLSEFYEKISHIRSIDLDNPDVPCLRLYPYPSSYNKDGRQVNFTYVRALQDGAACVAFLAQTEHAESPDLVVKFVSRYGQEVHRFLATDPDQLAPQLHYFGPLPDLPLPDDYHPKHMPLMSMVVMDYIKPSATPPDARQQIKNALDKLHERGFVLGDLREPNVLFDEDGKLKLIDFDWAGRYKMDEHSTDFVRYPLGLSPIIHWPRGATQFKPILPEHDIEMLNYLFHK